MQETTSTPTAASASSATWQATVYIVDDDDAVRDSLAFLLEGNRYKVRTFESASAFLDSAKQFEQLAQVGCLILDVRMPGMTGLELQEHLLNRGLSLPILFITGHGDVQMAVNTMKRGAVDFIEKPFKQEDLLARVENAIKLSAQLAHQQEQKQRIGRLTEREKEVLRLIVKGRLNKQIADDLNISIKTVEAHRANIMDKLQVPTMADLMKVAIASQSI